MGCGQIWGHGAFTLALAELLGPSAFIYTVDRDQGALRQQEQAMRTQFPSTKVKYLVGDFRNKLDLPILDGIVMANSLHFAASKAPVLKLVRDYLRPGGRLLLVEYNTDQGNTWVPHPLSYPSWEELAAQHGFAQTRLLATRPSRFLREIYSAASW